MKNSRDIMQIQIFQKVIEEFSYLGKVNLNISFLDEIVKLKEVVDVELPNGGINRTIYNKIERADILESIWKQLQIIPLEGSVLYMKSIISM